MTMMHRGDFAQSDGGPGLENDRGRGDFLGGSKLGHWPQAHGLAAESDGATRNDSIARRQLPGQQGRGQTKPFGGGIVDLHGNLLSGIGHQMRLGNGRQAQQPVLEVERDLAQLQQIRGAGYRQDHRILVAQVAIEGGHSGAGRKIGPGLDQGVAHLVPGMIEIPGLAHQFQGDDHEFIVGGGGDRLDLVHLGQGIFHGF